MTKVLGNWRPGRKSKHLPVSECFYIFCEGQKTEYNYFTRFKELISQNPVYRNRITVEAEGTGRNTMSLLRYAEEVIKEKNVENAKVWCVYDKDNFPDADFNGVITEVKKLNSQKQDGNEFHCAWSNECIEFWFLLHFCYMTSDIERQLYFEKLSGYLKVKYEKNLNNIFDLLLDKGNPRLAIRYAKKILNEHEESLPSEICPGTTVQNLVCSLAKYLPEGKKERFLDTEK